ncbi:MAG: hypothetical protein ACRCYU_09235 [Nocardioides sp.]
MKSFEELHAYAAALDVAEALGDDELTTVLHSMAVVDPPSYEYYSELITITLSSTGRGGGVSRKPGNILLSWRRLFDVGPDIGVAAVGSVGQNRFVHALIGLYVWNKVWRGSEVELSEAEASVIEALWRNSAQTRKLPADDAFALTNNLRLARDAANLSRPDFERALDILVSMACIEITGDCIWLREWVRKRT